MKSEVLQKHMMFERNGWKCPLYFWSGEAALFCLVIWMLLVVLHKAHVQMQKAKQSTLVLSWHNARINSLWYSQSAGVFFHSTTLRISSPYSVLGWKEILKCWVCCLFMSVQQRQRTIEAYNYLLLDIESGQFFNNKVLWHGWKHSFTDVDVLLIQHGEEKTEKTCQP